MSQSESEPISVYVNDTGEKVDGKRVVEGISVEISNSVPCSDISGRTDWFEGKQFKLSVEEAEALYNQLGESLIGAWFQRKTLHQQEREITMKAEEVMEFLNIRHVADELAENLSGGQKKLLELGRTMMVDAKVVILDEVGAGVNRTLLKEIGDAIELMNQEKGYTFCMIEHDMDFISRLCNPVIVMAEGKLLTEGSAEEVKSNELVIEAYLGRGASSGLN